MSELILSDNLKLTSIVKLTDERIKAFDMDDLKIVMESLTRTEAKLMVDAIKAHRFDKLSHIIEVAVFREMQGQAVKFLRRTI